MDMTKSNRICLVFLSLLVLVVPARNAFAQDANMLLCDGETNFQCENGSRNTTQAFRGQGCFEGIPDPWHTPVIRLGGLPSYRSNLSGYDEIWFFAKCDQLGKTFDVTISAYTGKSNIVNVSACIEGGVLDTTYRLVRIPISALKTATYTLDMVESIYFGLAKPTPGHKIYIDDIWAVKLSTVDPNTAPVVTGYGSISFGDVPVRTSQTKSVSVTNAGKGSLVVSSLSISGAQSGEFSIPTAPFTLQPGQSQRIDVVLSPTTPAEVAGTLSLSHNATVMGSMTNIPISGRGVSSLLVLPSDSLDFGTAPRGRTVSWPFLFNNKGNQDLVISNLTATQQFSVTPVTLSVPPDGTGEVRVSFTPAADGGVQGKLMFAANDPNHPQTEIRLDAEGVPASTGAATLTLRTPRITSSSVTLAWPEFTGADAINVYLAPEPEGTRDEPLYKMLVSQQPGASTGCVVGKLAADTDAFFRVETLSGTQVLAAGFVHVRTVGGPQAELDTALREVHLMGPNILQVVLLDKRVQSYATDTGTLIGDTGPQWQSGDWTLKRLDGTLIGVTAKYRHSVPAGENYYEVGYAANSHDDLVDVEHRIFLVLNAPLGNREILSVQGPLGAEFIIPYSDHYLETPVVQVNQVGYSPRSTERWAYVSGWMGDGGTLSMAGFPVAASVLFDYKDATTVRNAAVSNLPVSVRSANDEGAGGEVREINLSSVPPAEGVVYRVCLPGIGVSWPTQVSETAVFKTFFTVARGLYHNRWGRDLKEQWTEWAPRPVDHPTVFTAEGTVPDTFNPESTPQTGERPLVGGHHDAGDFDIRVNHSLVPMYLMRACEANPGAFTDGQLIIPESGNRIPDLLDEAIWNLNGWICLQEADGGVRMGVESWRHPFGIYHTDEDPLPYWTFAREPIHTARVAGLLAQAAWLIKPFADLNNQSDPVTQLYHKYSERAISAYTYATSNGVSEATQGPMLLASGELYRLTGDTAYKTKFEATWAANSSSWDPNSLSIYPYFPWASSWSDVRQVILGDHLMGYFTSSNPASGYLGFAHTKFAEQADAAVSVIHTDSAHRNSRPSGMPVSWGQATAIGHWINPVYHALQLGGLTKEKQQAYFNAMSLCADYILGGNPNGMVWITGLGSRHPENPLHYDSLAFIKDGKGPIPGIPVYGPTTTVPGVTHYRYVTNTFYPAFMDQPLLRHYADAWSFVTNNEFTVSECQAPDAELFAMLLKPGLLPPASWFPFQPEHRNPLAPRESATSGGEQQDTTPPTAGAPTAPAAVKTGPITVDYTGASDAGSGLSEVHLWVKNGTGGTWQDTGLLSTGASGSFNYTPTAPDVTYYFALRAVDKAGNVSAMPSGNGQANTMYDTKAPDPGQLTASPYSQTAPLTISYTGVQDALSGLKEVKLWVKKGTAGTWQNTGQTSTAASGAFQYQPTGDDRYFFFLQAEDKAGNVSPEPTDATVVGNPT